MKNFGVMVFFCTVFIVSLFCTLETSDWQSKRIDEKPKDVVDYFLRLPICWFDEARDTINVFTARKGYLTEGENRDVIVDIVNGYMRIRDFEFQLENRLTVTYFRRSDASVVIALSEYYEGGDCDTYRTTFYAYKGSKLKDITEKVLPEIVFKDFWNKDTTFSIEQCMFFDECLHWNYVLPRYGTTIKVSPEALHMFLCFELGSFSFEFDDVSEADSLLMEYFKIVRSRDYHSIELEWNREKGIFEVGKKIPF